MTTATAVDKSKQRQLPVIFAHLQSAVELTFEWRRRVAKETGFQPPTSYHRILLYMWCQENDGQPDVAVSAIARHCGLRLPVARNISHRMLGDNLVESDDCGLEIYLRLTDDGRRLAELSGGS